MISEAKSKGLWLAAAESLTGGALGAAIVSEPGASEVFLGSIVSYQDELKSQLLGVSAQLLAAQSAVDPEVAIQMAVGAREKMARARGVEIERVIGISTTGVAGPDSVGSKPVGEVYLGVSSTLGDRVYAEHFSGNREEIRAATLERALGLLRDEIAEI